MLPSLEFLLEVSLRTLEDLELTSLNQARNLSKTISREIEAWIDHEATAKLARWMIEKRQVQPAEPKKVEFLPGQSKKSA